MDGQTTVEVTGFRDAARVAVISKSGVAVKLGRSALTVGSGERCLVCPAIDNWYNRHYQLGKIARFHVLFQI